MASTHRSERKTENLTTPSESSDGESCNSQSQAITKVHTRRKLVIVGDGGCGKTSLLYAFGANTFLDDHEPTVFENYVTTVKINNKNVELSLWDTAGQEDLDRLRPLSYPDADVILICFSITDTTSFLNVADKWVPEVRHYLPSVPIILVATKCDLRYDQKTIAGLEKQGFSTLNCVEGESLATRVKANAYLECSSKTYEGVTAVFHKAAYVAIKNRKKGALCCTQ